MTGALMAAALAVAPVATASAAESDSVGEIGVLELSSSDTNQTSHWKQRYAEFDPDCFSSEGDTDHGTLTDGGKTVTLEPFVDSWHGNQWVVLVIKGGSDVINVIENPEPGVAYASPVNNGGQQSDVSHWIVCKGEVPATEPELKTVTPELAFTPPTCELAGELTRGDGVDWSSVVNDDGSTTWTASPKDGTKFPEGVQTQWSVPDLTMLTLDDLECRGTQPPDDVTSVEAYTFDCDSVFVTITTTTTTTPYVWGGTAWVPAEQPTVDVETETRNMTAEEKMDCPLPDTTIEYGAWTDGDWECGDTTVEQTREVSTTVYEYAADGTPTAKSSVAVETQTRALTQDEIGECPLLPGDITSVCVGDVPYLGYDVTLPEGYVPTSENPVTITFVNPDGDDYVVSGQPLAGSLLWPGASDEDPMMWPGWELVDGEYAPTDGNFAWTREGITVRFAVNPTYETTVMYPEATALCANPPIGGPDGVDEIPGTDEPADADEPTGTPASTDSEALAVTGGGAVSPIVVTAGAAAIAAGIALLVVMAYRRRRAEIG